MHQLGGEGALTHLGELGGGLVVVAKLGDAAQREGHGMERGQGQLSAVQEVGRDYGLPVIAVASLDDLMTFLTDRPDFKDYATAVARYRQEYGVARAG